MAKWDIRPGDLLRDIYNDDFGAIFRDLGLTGLRGVILKTPVDTGRLRGGWLVTINSATGETPGTLDASGSATIARGASVIGGAKLGETLIIQNNVDYAIFINDGTEKIAPRRMVERTVAELQRNLQ